MANAETGKMAQLPPVQFIEDVDVYMKVSLPPHQPTQPIHQHAYARGLRARPRPEGRPKPVPVRPTEREREIWGGMRNERMLTSRLDLSLSHLIAIFVVAPDPPAEQDKAADAVMRELQEKFQTFKLLESRLLQSRARMMGKVPHIEKAIEMVALLLEKETSAEQITVDFELSDQVYTKATINKGTQTVYLWLGANVMVEYSLTEAKGLLEQNRINANANIANHEKDLNFVRDSITTLEVSLARVYNWDVMQRAKAKPAA